MALLDIFKGKSEPVDLSVLKTDIHSHFIPGIDDGSKSIDNSLELIRGMESLGYQKVITTPHIMSDSYRNTPEIILSGLQKVREAVAKANMKIQVDAAAEYYLDYELEKKIKDKIILTFGGDKKYMLWEMSFVNPPDNMNQAVFEMQMNGYKPVLAHVERYNFWHKDYSKYEELVSRGILLQMNINSLTGHYSEATKKAAHWLIDRNMISFAGSDCHHTGHIDLLHHVLKDKYLRKLIDSGKLLNSTL